MPNIISRFVNAGMREVKSDIVRKLGGVSGTQSYGGYITDEDPINRGAITKTLNWDSSRDRADMVEEMETDDTVEAMLNAIHLPIKQSEWSVEPASEKRVDKKIADALKEDFIGNPNYSLKELEEHLLTFLTYGNVVMIKSFEMPEGLGRVRWKNWAYRKQRTIDRWDVDVLGNLRRVHQEAVTVNSEMVDLWIPEKAPSSSIENPIFHMAYKQLGDNFNGRSILRQVWRWYFVKRNAVPKLGRQMELGATGIPRVTYKNGLPQPGSAEETRINTLLENLRASEKMNIKQSDDFTLDLFGGGDFVGIDIPKIVQFCNQSITKSILAMFIEKPMMATGAYSMQESLFGIFLDNLEGIANQIEEVLNDGRRGMQHVKQYVNLNWSNVTEYPKLRKSKVNAMSADNLIELVTKYINAGGLMTEADWNYLRVNIGFNEIELDEFKAELDDNLNNPEDLN